MLSLSGHKIGAPKGIGALVVANPEAFHPFICGGKQEAGDARRNRKRASDCWPGQGR